MQKTAYMDGAASPTDCRHRVNIFRPVWCYCCLTSVSTHLNTYSTAVAVYQTFQFHMCAASTKYRLTAQCNSRIVCRKHFTVGAWNFSLVFYSLSSTPPPPPSSYRLLFGRWADIMCAMRNWCHRDLSSNVQIFCKKIFFLPFALIRLGEHECVCVCALCAHFGKKHTHLEFWRQRVDFSSSPATDNDFYFTRRQPHGLFDIICLSTLNSACAATWMWTRYLLHYY